MTITSNTYVPREAYQPRGGRPWCARCHTDRHLLADSVTVLDSREGTLALAVTCTRCGGSRVLATTADFAAAMMGTAGMGDRASDLDFDSVHCREPMSLVVPVPEYAAAQPGPPKRPAGHYPFQVLRCRCGFQMDAPPARHGTPT